MILVDAATGSWELQSLIRKQGINCDKTHLDSADACFEGQGPEGTVLVGIERKRLQDALDCIDTGRLGGFQLPKMRRMYKFRFVVIEGQWKPDRSGVLLEAHVQADHKVYWGDQRYGGKRVMYAKLRRYLFSITMAGAHVLYTTDIAHTAYDICELYHWFAKPWRQHTSMQQMYTGYAWDAEVKQSEELVMIPTLDRRPSLVRRWAASLDGIGVKLSADAERVFRTPRALADADEADWLNIPSMTMKSATDLVKQITGRK